MIAYYDSSMTATPTMWTSTVNISQTGGTITGTVTPSQDYWFRIPSRYEEPKTALGPSLYQIRLQRSLDAIADRVRVDRHHPRRVVALPRQIARFGKRTCSMASRWRVSQ